MINLQSNQHAFFAGKTQQGKTTLVRSFVNNFPRVVVHDRKFEWKNFAMRNGYKVVHEPSTLQELLSKGAKRIIYQPRSPEMDDFDEICKIIFYTGNITLVIDEASSYCSTGRVPFYCGELLRLGSGRGIGVISLSQRPRYVDNVMISESTIIVSFRLMLDTDRLKISQIAGKTVDPPLPENPSESEKIRSIANLKQYHFMVFDSSTNAVSWHKPIPVRTAEPIKIEDPKVEETINNDKQTTIREQPPDNEEDRV